MKRSTFIQQWVTYGNAIKPSPEFSAVSQFHMVNCLTAAERLADLVAEKYSFDPEDPAQTDPASQLLHDAIGLLQLRVQNWIVVEGSWNAKAAETVAAYHKLFHP